MDRPALAGRVSMAKTIAVALAALLLTAQCPSALAAEPVETKVVKTADGFGLLRAGKPYFIKGGGGSGSKAVLVECGGNSIRTWGVGKDTQGELDDAQKLGLTVTVGIWLGHKEHGFRWDDAAAVKRQFEDAKKAIEKYKDHPALLCWGIGNEMENPGNDTEQLWQAVQDLAKMAHEVDPKHPTMTVVAEIGGKKLQHIKQFCPDIDIVGLNSYGGGPSLGERYKKADVGKPYVITEFGPPGTWECPKTDFGTPIEQTSTAKANAYRATYEKSIAGAKGLCLGSYAFIWGNKVEATATWYGMFLPGGEKLAAVDTMAELWSGKAPAHKCPEMNSLSLTTSAQVAPQELVKAAVDARDVGGDKLTIKWALFRELGTYDVTGPGAKMSGDYSACILTNGAATVELKAPAEPGVYRLYCYVYNTHGGAAVGSVTMKVKTAG